VQTRRAEERTYADHVGMRDATQYCIDATQYCIFAKPTSVRRGWDGQCLVGSSIYLGSRGYYQHLRLLDEFRGPSGVRTQDRDFGS